MSLRDKIISDLTKVFNPKKYEATFYSHLPPEAGFFIASVLSRFQHGKARDKARDELIAMFDSALAPISDPDLKSHRAADLISDLPAPRKFASQIKRRQWLARPLWQRIGIRSFGWISLYLFVLITVLSLSKPYRTVDYISVLNHDALKGRDPNVNASIFYDRAASLCVYLPNELTDANFWPSKLSSHEKALCRSWLRDNEKAIPLILQGTCQPYYAAIIVDPCSRQGKREFDFDSTLIYALANPENNHYKLFKEFMYILSRSASFAAYDANTTQAIHYNLALMRFARQFQCHGAILDQLLGLTAEKCAMDTFFHLAADHNSAPVILNEISAALADLSPGLAPIDMTVEKTCWLDFIQLCYTKYNTPSWNSAMLFIRMRPFRISPYIICPFVYTKSRALSQVDSYFKAYDNLYRTKPFLMQDTNVPVSPFLFEPILQPPKNPRNVPWQILATRLAFDTTIAILKFKNDRATLPADLNDLRSAGYISKIPMDPFSGRPLAYCKTQGDFVLYSVGSDRIDNNAARPPKKSNSSLPPPPSDIVFWPLEN